MIITVFGSYNKSSVGDKAILVSLLELLFKYSPNELKVEVFEFQKGAIIDEISDYKWKNNVKILSLGETKKNLKKNRRNLFKTILPFLPKSTQTLIAMLLSYKSISRFDLKNSDALIIGGGNLLMDLYPSWPGRLFALYYFFKKNSKPIYLLGVGAFPIRKRLSDFLLKKIAQNSKQILVRDKNTLKYVREHWRLKSEYIPDLAFSYPIKNIPLHSQKTNKIAINVIPVYGEDWPYQNEEKYTQYIKNVSRQLLKYSRVNKETKYVFFDTNYPMNRTATLAVIEELQENNFSKELISYEDKLHTSKEITEIIMKCDFAVVTKLHAAILALRTGLPILALEYQPKVRSVLNAVGIDNEAILELNQSDLLFERMMSLDKSKKSFKLDKNILESIQIQNSKAIRKILKDIKSYY